MTLSTRVERPLLVGRGVYPQRSTHTHAVLALLAAQSQAGFAIDPVHPFMVHMPAFTAQQHMQSTVTITRLSRASSTSHSRSPWLELRG